MKNVIIILVFLILLFLLKKTNETFSIKESVSCYRANNLSKASSKTLEVNQELLDKALELSQLEPIYLTLECAGTSDTYLTYDPEDVEEIVPEAVINVLTSPPKTGQSQMSQITVKPKKIKLVDNSKLVPYFILALRAMDNKIANSGDTQNFIRDLTEMYQKIRKVYKFYINEFSRCKCSKDICPKFEVDNTN